MLPLQILTSIKNNPGKSAIAAIVLVGIIALIVYFATKDERFSSKRERFSWWDNLWGNTQDAVSTYNKKHGIQDNVAYDYDADNAAKLAALKRSMREDSALAGHLQGTTIRKNEGDQFLYVSPEEWQAMQDELAKDLQDAVDAGGDRVPSALYGATDIEIEAAKRSLEDRRIAAQDELASVTKLLNQLI